MRPGTVLVCGAGIAGATLTYWLARAGWTVTVVEKAAGTRSSGNPVDVRREAAAVTTAMGLGERLRAADTGVTHAAFVDATGRTRAVIRTRRDPGPAAHEVEVARADLAAALLDAVRADAEVVLGDAPASLTQDADGVEVQFERAPARCFDLVVGADGLHSAVRRLAFGPESAYARSFGMVIGTLRADLGAADPTRVVMYNEPGRLLAVHPAGGTPAAAFIFRTEHPVGPQHRGDRRLVEEAYANAGWRGPELLEHWRAAEDVYLDAVTRIELPSWSRGRIALVGDAASCLSLFGEGASNAILGARTLAGALGAHQDLATAFAAYERAHRVRIRRARRGAAVGSHLLVPATRPGIGARDAALRWTASARHGLRRA